MISDNNEKKSCCCGNKEAEQPTKQTIEQPADIPVAESCCCSDNKKQQTEPPTTSPAAESCCCSDKKEEYPTSCCSSHKKEETASCCSDKKEKPAAESCCCSHQKEETASCCSSHKPKPAPICGCCHDDTPRRSSGSCCHDDAPPKNTFWGKYKNWIRLPVSLVSLILSYIFTKLSGDWLHEGFWRYFDFGMIAVILCGIPLVITAVKKLIRGKGFKGKVTSSLLVSTAMIACVALELLLLFKLIPHDGHDHSYMFAAGEVAFLVTLGGVLENYTIGKARAGIEGLARLTPLKAKYMIDGVIIEKPLSEVRVGDLVTILPDDMVSVDGIVEEGFTSIDQSVMTGESIPVDKAPGDTVFGGTYNKGGAFTVRVTKAENAMAITKLKRLVEEAEGQKAPISGLAERAASFIVPAAIILSFAIFGLNMLLMGKAIFADSAIQAIERGVTMLVVFCPCALVLATPTAIAAGLGNAARNGILIKSGATLEELGRVKSVAFDKTGTLTEGSMFVDAVVSAPNYSEEYVAQKAAAAESLSGHPIARAISALHPGLTAESIKSIAGFGVEAVVGEDKITVTKYVKSIAEVAEQTPLNLNADTLLGQGKTVVSVFENDILIGIIALGDKVRAGSLQCVQDLNDMGVSSYMLTGDNHDAARHIASQAGIAESNVFSALLPEEKLRKIEELKARESVCMIGDGVNDAPALALANCSLAMGAMGSDTAIEAASAALMTSDLKKVPFILRLGRKVLRTIKFNIILSMSINIAAVILSTFGIINPAWGALIHNASSILVVLNSAFLLRTK